MRHSLPGSVDNGWPADKLSAVESPMDLETLYTSLHWPKLAVRREIGRTDLQGTTPFPDTSHLTFGAIEDLAGSSHELDRAMGCLTGLAVGDAIGHPLEFLPVASDSGEGMSSWSLTAALLDESKNPYLYPRAPEERSDGKEAMQPHAPGYTRPANKFALDAGQWTDDTAMALCLADSLLKCGRLDGSDVRLQFWSWWYCGLNNAFRKDQRRAGSVGLGGNISRSLHSLRPGQTPEPVYAAHTTDSGNGSLMRLAPIALYHLRTRDMAMVHADARLSSLTTHPGPIAAEACAFLGHLLVAAITRFHPGARGAARAFIVEVADDYEAALGRTSAAAPGVGEVRRLLRATEPEGSPERCWNWRGERLDIGATMRARGDAYNGYPNSADYFGSYCLDGLAMALHSVAMTDSFDDAIERCVNLLGDADSTGAIAGQIAGAMYGYRAIHPRLRSDLHDWDDGQVALRAALLATRSVGVAAAPLAAPAPTPKVDVHDMV